MKVQGPGSRPNVAQVQDKAHVKSTGTAQVEKSAGERVEVSSLSKLLATAREPDVGDPAKVERLRESIRVGEFQVDHARVAESMVQEEV
jgi:flagellar biosynthesis anti-sigma factor FlgM